MQMHIDLLLRELNGSVASYLTLLVVHRFSAAFACQVQLPFLTPHSWKSPEVQQADLD